MTAASSFTDPTVFVALIGVFGSLAAIVLASMLSTRNQRDTKAKVEEIHVIVNSQKTEMEKRIAALEEKLGLSPGEEIPAPRIVTSQTEVHQPEGT